MYFRDVRLEILIVFIFEWCYLQKGVMRNRQVLLFFTLCGHGRVTTFDKFGCQLILKTHFLLKLLQAIWSGGIHTVFTLYKLEQGWPTSQRSRAAFFIVTAKSHIIRMDINPFQPHTHTFAQPDLT